MRSISTAVVGPWVLLILSSCSRSLERGSPAGSVSVVVPASSAAFHSSAIVPLPSDSGSQKPSTVASAVLVAPWVDGGASLKLDRPSDLGPAGSLAISARGAVFRTRSDELALVVLDALATDPHKKITPADDQDAASEDALASRAPPPALTRTHAYWVSQGRLVRRPLAWQAGSRATLEVIATGAQGGSRVAADTSVPDGGGNPRDVVIYIAQAVSATDDRVARVWIEGGGGGAFSGDGSGSSSVALARAGERLVGFSLDARSAMSPVHARTIDVGSTGAPRMGADVVVFVGPSPEGHAEIVAAPGPGGPMAFIPFARDTTSFGLASLLIGDEPHLDAPVHWSMYPNGIEPAPVAAAVFCNRTWAAYVRPQSAAVGAQSALVLAPIDRGAFGAEIIAGQGFDFTTVALAARDDGGAWLAWVGNGRSWVRGIRC